MFRFVSVIVLSLAFSTLAFADGKRFEYKMVNYTVQAEFAPILVELGNQGWELASCVTSGAANYTATTNTGVYINSQIARTSYCVFKKEIN
jgi:hypothetical protein